MKPALWNAPVAVVGMACRLPGAENIEELWELVRAGGKAFGPVPADRFDRELYYDPRKGALGKSYSDLGGVIQYGPIDRRLCPIPDEALERYDLAHLTLCEVAAAACRHAGMDPRDMPYRNTGVYIGHARASGLGGDLAYAAHVAEAARFLHEVPRLAHLPHVLRQQLAKQVVTEVRRHSPVMTPRGPFLSANLAAGLIAKFFRLDGPAMVFNAACASSLHAVVQAVRALQSGSIDMALVGGASYFHSDTLVLFSQAQSLSQRGSFPFSDEADGLVVAEGYVVLVLKMLDRALADGNRVLAVIPSVSVSTDGRGKSLWAPRKEGQVEAMRRAYSEAVPADQVQYIEAHATSTALGDATELAALAEFFGRVVTGPQKIPVGSIKANVGHTLEAAGATSLAKVVLALSRHTIPPGIDDRPLNRQVDWERLPVFVPRQALPWPAPPPGMPRRAAVNAFGIGGMNVHVVVDEFVPPARPVLGAARVPAPARRGLSPADRAVAVVGMGAILPGARTLEAFGQLVMSGRDARTAVPPARWSPEYYRDGAADPWSIPNTLGGFITDFQYDWRKHKIPPKQIQQASPLQFMILDAVDQALEGAGYHQRPLDRKRTGVVVGTIFGGDFSGQLAVALQWPRLRRTVAQVLRQHGLPEPAIEQATAQFYDLLLRHMPALLDETGSFTANVLASRITKTFDLMGGGVAVDAGTASALAALACASDLLLAGHCDLMICVGAQQAMSPATYLVWNQLGALGVGRPPAPFDAHAAGAVPGEGCGVLLLKRLEDARRDSDRVLATIRGLGAAYGLTRAESIEKAARRALAAAGLAPAQVALLETLGTGNPRLDAEELAALARVYPPNSPSTPLHLGTLVGQIGNTGGASGAASLIKAALELDGRQVAPLAPLDRPADFLLARPSRIQVPTQPQPIQPADSATSEIAAINSCGGDEPVYHVLMERGAPVISTANYPLPASEEVSAVIRPNDAASRILYFDATVRRREAMRRRAAGASARDVTLPSGEDLDHRDEGLDGPDPTLSQQPPVQPSIAASAEAPQPPTRSQPQAPSSSLPVAGAKPAPAAAELESFLVNFVVEQTGYPPEIVELDADLEADLGIDSIKKAQLFGELGEYFDIQPDPNLSLDDFPTLRHVLDYLSARVGGSAAPAPAPSSPVPAANSPFCGGNGAVPSPKLTAGSPELSAAAPEPPAASPVPSVSGSPRPVAGAKPTPAAAELESFLVNFVVEQTGYPPEIVELDADLEADLGIDSIKKAQLFGELGEYFDIQPDPNLSLDDFPTLRHVLEYLSARVGGSAAPGPAPSSLVPAASPLPGAASAAVAAPEPPAASPVPSVSGSPRPVAGAKPTPAAAELESFLVNFVVEQTGYPPEIVELDADLEADLGIDSIKKAQLFGELGEYFDIQPDPNLSLDDFPTLRHVLEYLIRAGAAQRPKAAAR